MKKVVLFFLVGALLVSTLALAGCSRGNDEDLVGTWAWEDFADYTYVFNSDGTGTRGVTGARESFTWSTSSDQLRINREGDIPSGEIRNERWTYTIDGDVFSIVSRQDTSRSYSYVRQ